MKNELKSIKMKLYRVSQSVITGYDVYDSMVVCAENEEEARKMSPSEFYQFVDGVFIWKPLDAPEQEDKQLVITSWVSRPSDVVVEYLGEAREGLKSGVIIASFNEG